MLTLFLWYEIVEEGALHNVCDATAHCDTR